jgi:stearoyl-CoA desaturase (delta-9 desaturase)
VTIEQSADGLIARTGRLSRFARAHAALMLIVPSSALVLALLQVVRGRVTGLDLASFFGMYALSALGVTAGYHRHLAHRAFVAAPFVRVLLIGLGAMAAQGPPVYWVALHRRHHQRSDRAGDPHSPYVDTDGAPLAGGLRGWLHAHAGWQFDHRIPDATLYCRDLFRDRLVLRLNRHYPALVALGLLAPALVGALVTRSLAGAASCLLWGGVLRLFLSYHATNSINSVTHMLGARDFATSDHSRNNAYLALVTLGESWHNNHHAFPGSAYFGLRWWQLDLGALAIRALAWLGWARDIRAPSAAAIANYAASHPRVREEPADPERGARI